MNDAGERDGGRLTDEQKAERELETAGSLAASGRYEESVAYYGRAIELFAAIVAAEKELALEHRALLLNSAGSDGADAIDEVLIRLLRESAVEEADVSGGGTLGLWDRLFFHGSWIGSEARQGRAERSLAEALYETGRYVESLAQYRRAAELGAFEKHEEDLPHYERMVRLLAQTDDVEWEARVWASWERTLRWAGRYDEALICCARLVDLFESCGTAADEAQAELEWCDVLHENEQHREADEHQQRAIDLLVSIEGVAGAACAELDRAMDYELYPVSLPHSRRAAELFRSTGNTKSEAEAEDAYAWAASAFGNSPESIEESLHHWQRAAELYARIGDVNSEAFDHERWARALSLLERHEESLVHWQRAAEGGAYGAEQALAEALSELDRYEDSLVHWERASEQALDRSPMDGAHAERGWARALWGLTRYPDSVPHFEQAAGLFATENQAEEEANCRLRVAAIRGFAASASRSDEDIAIFVTTADAFLDSYERAREGLTFLVQRQHLQKEWVPNVKVLAGIALDLGLDELLWNLDQSVKGRTFPEEGATNELWRRLLAEHPDLAQAQRAVEQLQIECDRLSVDALYEPFLRGGSRDDRKTEHAKKLAELRGAEARTNEILADIALGSPETVAMISISPVPLAGLQAILRPDEAYLGFFWLSKALVCFVVSAEKWLCSEIKGGQFEALWRWLQRARKDHERYGDWEVLRNGPQSNVLLGGLPEGVTTLLISPDGELAGTPFHCLAAPNEDHGAHPLLGERYTIGIVPVAGTLVQARESARSDPASSYLGIACNADNTIPGVDREVMHVAGRYFGGPPPGEAYLTEHNRSLLDERGSVGALHLACHAGPHGLLLRKGNEWITPVDLLGLQMKTDILVCTGCSAGRFSGEDGNEFLGIVRQLLVATGARAAVVSLQPVPDAAGIAFADLLFGALTGDAPMLGWGACPPIGTVTLADAVERARARMGELDAGAIGPLVGGLPSGGARLRDSTGLLPSSPLEPAHPTWRDPWFVVGDPSVRLLPDAQGGSR